MNRSLATFFFTSIFALFVFTPGVKAVASNVCFCHNVNHNPVTICTSNSGLINGHSNHVANGSDTLGVCPVTTVPEFGLIPGIVALVGSAGSFLVFRKRV